MNQEKIGKFIAECRKDKNLTQVQLAERLGVTDRSVSKWETGKSMPDLSLFQPLCKELDITLNELLSGKRLNEEECYKNVDENIASTIDYANKRVNRKNRMIGVILLVFGFLITLTAIAIFPSESSWSSVYSILGTLVAMFGFSKLIHKLNFGKRFILDILFLFLFILFLFGLDYINVCLNQQAPRFSTIKVSGDSVMYYDTPFYDVYRCNTDQKNEYWVIQKNHKYNIDMIDQYCK